MTKFNVASIAQKIGSSDKETELHYAAIVEFLKANPKSEKEIQADFMAGYISGKLAVSMDYGRAILVKAGKDTKSNERRTMVEHNAWNTAKQLFARLRDRAGLKDEAKSAAKKESAKAKAEPVEKAAKPESSIPVYKNAADLNQTALAMLSKLAADYDANAGLVKKDETAQFAARVIRAARDELKAKLK
jgi:hypothetical protein